MSKMKALIIFLFGLLSFNVTCGQTRIEQYLGLYRSRKSIELPVVEMSVHEANMDINKIMRIDIHQLVLFSDTLRDVKYKFNRRKSIEYFRVFRHFDYTKIANANKIITIISVETPISDPHAPKDIIVTGKYLIVEYRGYFFYFKKVAA